MSEKINGCIYKIVCNDSKKVYIGSTFQSIDSRLKAHESAYKRYINNRSNSRYNTSYEVIEGGNYKIELLDSYDSIDREGLCRSEGEYQMLYRCVNKNIAGRSVKTYYINNRKELLNKVKEYQRLNIDKITEKNNRIVTCKDCGSCYKYKSSYLHKKSSKHLQSIS